MNQLSSISFSLGEPLNSTSVSSIKTGSAMSATHPMRTSMGYLALNLFARASIFWR